MTSPLAPTTRLLACPACLQHVRSSAASCPHCGARLGAREGALVRKAAVVLGLSLGGCATAEPIYGVPETASASEPATETATETATEADTEGDTEDTTTEGGAED